MALKFLVITLILSFGFNVLANEEEEEEVPAATTKVVPVKKIIKESHSKSESAFVKAMKVKNNDLKKEEALKDEDE